MKAGRMESRSGQELPSLRKRNEQLQWLWRYQGDRGKWQIYEAYLNFDRLVRESNISMTDYVIEFEKRYSRVCKYKMELPDAVLALKLLHTACLDVKNCQLALRHCIELTFASMKSTLKRIFGGQPTASNMGINQETAYATLHRQRRNKLWSKTDQQEATLQVSRSVDR